MKTTDANLVSDNDLKLMETLHAAFRRDTARLAGVSARFSSREAEVHDALLLGWHGFSWSLHHHHVVEDDYIWPLMRQRLADDPDDLAVLDAMEAEHALIDPALDAVEQAFDDPERGPEELPARIGELVDLVHGHLGHEEHDAFPLIKRVITVKEWEMLSKDALKELSFNQIAELGPYLLEGASPERRQSVLRELPLPLRLVHRFWWNPRYQRRPRWENP
jgi:iron-sulfur cluster repair protein YtfE (RIC family)